MVQVQLQYLNLIYTFRNITIVQEYCRLCRKAKTFLNIVIQQFST
jgi:hypothetical protein